MVNRAAAHASSQLGEFLPFRLQRVKGTCFTSPENQKGGFLAV
jgi:hypothetical protein